MRKCVLRYGKGKKSKGTAPGCLLPGSKLGGVSKKRAGESLGDST